MLIIKSTIDEKEKERIRGIRNAPGYPFPHGMLQDDNEYWVKVKVNDSIVAEDSLVRLLQH